MPKVLVCCVFIILVSFSTSGQEVVYASDFGSGCNTGQLLSAFSSEWTISNTGVNELSSNQWFVSAAENNMGAGNCGNVCGNSPTLHIGNVSVLGIQADLGAAYYEGLAGFCGLLPCGATDKRAESPIIDCTGAFDLMLDLIYIEGGNAIDNGTIWYFDGNNWTQIDDPPKTFSGLCSPQGIWTARSISLPASANDNPDVQIGFRWVNNDDGDATDPSFAIADIVLSGLVEQGDCLGDFNEDGIINTADLLLFLSNFGCTLDCPYDLIDDEAVNTADLLIMLQLLGAICD